MGSDVKGKTNNRYLPLSQPLKCKENMRLLGVTFAESDFGDIHIDDLKRKYSNRPYILSFCE